MACRDHARSIDGPLHVPPVRSRDPRASRVQSARTVRAGASWTQPCRGGDHCRPVAVQVVVADTSANEEARAAADTFVERRERRQACVRCRAGAGMGAWRGRGSAGPGWGRGGAVGRRARVRPGSAGARVRPGRVPALVTSIHGWNGRDVRGGPQASVGTSQSSGDWPMRKPAGTGPPTPFGRHFHSVGGYPRRTRRPGAGRGRGVVRYTPRTMSVQSATIADAARVPLAPTRIFSGIQPSGAPHIGNDLGAIRNYVALQDRYEAIYCIVDYHALTSLHDPDRLRRQTREMAAALLALGLDPERCTLFVQSHRPEHTELAWLLATVTPVSWLERTPTYKEKKRNQPDDINHGAAHLPGPPGRRHRDLQGEPRAGRQGPGRRTSSCRARSCAPSTPATGRRSPSRRPCSPRRRSSWAPTARAR